MRIIGSEKMKTLIAKGFKEVVIWFLISEQFIGFVIGIW